MNQLQHQHEGKKLRINCGMIDLAESVTNHATNDTIISYDTCIYRNKIEDNCNHWLNSTMPLTDSTSRTMKLREHWKCWICMYIWCVSSYRGRSIDSGSRKKTHVISFLSKINTEFGQTRGWTITNKHVMLMYTG